ESKRIRHAGKPLKALYALWEYPQLSESYIRTEIRAVRQLGVEVEVWSEEDVAAPFESEVPVHRGSLTEAIARFKPDVDHTHWLQRIMRLFSGPHSFVLTITSCSWCVMDYWWRST